MIKPCDAAWLCVAAIWSAATPAAIASVQINSSTAAGLSPGFETEIAVDLDMLFAAGDLRASRDDPIIDARIRLASETVRDDGRRWGVRAGFAINSGDGRRGFSQLQLQGPVERGQALTGLATGFTAARGLDAGSGRAAIDRAELFLIGDFIEWRAGVGETAARSSDIRPTLALRLVRADGAISDLAGGGLATTTLSLSAPAPRIHVESRRLLGIAAAASFTPDAARCGVDQCRPGATGAVASPDLDNIISVAASFDRRSRQSGVRWRIHGGFERGAVSSPLASYEDPWIATIEAAREADGLTLGVRGLRSNDGFKGDQYSAVSAMGAVEREDWLYSLELAYGESGVFDVDGASLALGASRLVGDSGLISLGYVGHDSGGAGVVAEIGLRF